MSEPEKDDLIRALLDSPGLARTLEEVTARVKEFLGASYALQDVVTEAAMEAGTMDTVEVKGKPAGMVVNVLHDEHVFRVWTPLDEAMWAYDIKDVEVRGMTGGGTCGRVRPCKEETWRDRPPML